MVKNRPKILTIAGFDPSGGAGVLSDIKTFEQNKTLGFAVVTANTIQTENKFHSINWIEKKMILTQLQFLLNQYTFDWVKIGLIEDVDILTSVITKLKTHNAKVKIIWDPILQATSGGDFDEKRFSNTTEILKNIYAITPNLSEYQMLFGTNFPLNLATQNNLFVLLKGGHADQKGRDLLYSPSGKSFPLNPKKVVELDKHGTGCVLSAAWLSYLSRRFPPLKSMARAKNYLEKRLLSNPTRLAYHK